MVCSSVSIYIHIHRSKLTCSIDLSCIITALSFNCICYLTFDLLVLLWRDKKRFTIVLFSQFPKELLTRSNTYCSKAERGYSSEDTNNPFFEGNGINKRKGVLDMWHTLGRGCVRLSQCNTLSRKFHNTTLTHTVCDNRNISDMKCFSEVFYYLNSSIIINKTETLRIKVFQINLFTRF